MDRKNTVGLLVAGIVLVGQSFTVAARRSVGFSVLLFEVFSGCWGLSCSTLHGSIAPSGFTAWRPRSTVGNRPNPLGFTLWCSDWRAWWSSHHPRVDDDGFFLEPAGLLLTLMGVLALMNGVYVWLITSGPLAEEEE